MHTHLHTSTHSDNCQLHSLLEIHSFTVTELKCFSFFFFPHSDAHWLFYVINCTVHYRTAPGSETIHKDIEPPLSLSASKGKYFLQRLSRVLFLSSSFFWTNHLLCMPMAPIILHEIAYKAPEIYLPKDLCVWYRFHIFLYSIA